MTTESGQPANPKIEALIAKMLAENPKLTREDVLEELEAWGVLEDTHMPTLIPRPKPSARP